MMSMQQKINNHIANFNRDDILIKRWHVKGLSDASRDISWRYMPSMERYFFDLNASFVYDYDSIDSLVTYPFVMLRDGFFGLFYFFLKNPKPPVRTETTILIPAKFSFLVPKTWKDNILIYEFDYPTKSKSIKRGIYYGLPSKENFISLDENSKLDDGFDKDISIHNAVYGRDRFFDLSVNDQGYYINFCKSLYKRHGFDVEESLYFDPTDWSNVNSSDSFFNIDTDNFMVYADYLSFLFSSKGAEYFNKPERLINDSDVISTINMSPFHTLKVGQLNEFNDWTMQRLIKIKLNGISLHYHSVPLFEFALAEFKTYLKSGLVE